MGCIALKSCFFAKKIQPIRSRVIRTLFLFTQNSLRHHIRYLLYKFPHFKLISKRNMPLYDDPAAAAQYAQYATDSALGMISQLWWDN